MVMLDHGLRLGVRESVIANLERLDSWAIVLELIMLAIMATSLGHLARHAFEHWPGHPRAGVRAPRGAGLPAGPQADAGPRAAVVASVFVLLGGYALRAAVVGMPLPLLASHQ